MNDQPPDAPNTEPETRALPAHAKPFASGRAYLNQLLSERNQHAERATDIDREITRTFERRVAILAMDMCGFTQLTMAHGIIHFLAMIRQMDEVARPAIQGNGGRVIKQEADDMFAVFNEPAQAVEAALDILRGFAAINKVLPPERHLHGSIGIGYGDTLVIGDEDLFGSEMNLACKLGEDIAGHDEILITTAAYTALPAGRYLCRPVRFAIGELDIHCYRYEQSLFA
ncbi:MAG TPA: adenylate/guanylate cyclase domain-containing protein [Blastocatellia bacterium]|nr:adenylate/guanylate cyclase domain-containing protein [Blastocatellia bacterium]